jgi:hypothetical protein
MAVGDDLTASRDLECDEGAIGTGLGAVLSAPSRGLTGRSGFPLRSNQCLWILGAVERTSTDCPERIGDRTVHSQSYFGLVNVGAKGSHPKTVDWVKC